MTNLRDRLKARIDAEGFISVADYMQACVQTYYATQQPFGVQGDFTTAPEISQIFGEIIGAWVAHAWLTSGMSQAAMVELGGGRGTLMKDALRATQTVSQFHERIQVVMVESSVALAKLQRETLAGAHPRVSSQTGIDPLPPCPCFFIANEFFDALPIEQTVQAEVRKIIWEHESFAFNAAQTGTIRERCPPAETLMQRLCAHLKTYGGALLAADYGHTKTRSGDTLQAVKNHRYIDIFACPGEADITAHVNFETLAAIATNQGLTVEVLTQGAFLQRHGAKLRLAALCKHADQAQQDQIVQGLERLMAPEQMGELFKVLLVVA